MFAFKLSYLLKISESYKSSPFYYQWASQLEAYNSLEEYLTNPSTEKRLQDVYSVYLGQWDLHRSRQRRAGLYAKKINMELERIGKTRYSLCKELNFNCGNFYAFLDGDNTKISYEKARKAYEYLTV